MVAGIFKTIFGKMDIVEFKLRRKAKDKPEEKPSILKDILDNPESFELRATIENEEVVVRIRRKEEEESH